ncbi:Do family serine endopeptidase [Sandaracinomonas limnophila]|uniref:Do family serine endopeptidase n=1 Tax=Sandaracinomonas limnophila TaxID=1862386 RepID=UPI0026BCBB09|nr:Do family serine endopeptidase [Sandaracinomonas limnophila]
MEIKNQIKPLLLVGLVSSGLTLGAYHLLNIDNSSSIGNAPSAFTTNVSSVNVPGNPGEFTFAAEKSTPAVVHIKTKSAPKSMGRQFSSPFDDFFGFGDPFGGGGQQRRMQPQEASGSGVIISADGYIVTNNHVVEDADEITVVLNDKREFKGKIISTDPSSDLAVVQIKAENLPFLTFGDSDNLRVGEWVLAVGNPFNLESTVTAGIVSAKGRQNIIDRDPEGKTNPLESFIQTDAAVNPGNSGGALVNLKGELVGINTAIYSRTGQFAGYSFAVPVSIVKKVSGDLIKYGNVQRGYLGVQIIEVNSKLAEEKDLKTTNGVYVGGFSENSAGKEAGLKVNDVITKVDGVETKTSAKLMEIVNRKRPGEVVDVTVNRDGANKEFKVTLRNLDGNTSIVKGSTGETSKSDFLGAKFGTLSQADKSKYKVTAGVKVTEIDADGRLAMYGIEKGVVITKINDKAVNSPNEAIAALEGKKGRIKLEGVDVDGSRFIYVL